MRGNKVLKTFIVLVVLAAVAVGVYFVLIKTGIIWHDEVDEDLYKVRGVAVSELNGNIDWVKAQKEGGVDFALIKATEGTAFKDANYGVNYVNAVKAGVKVGFYHDFVVGNSGETQAKHYINNVRVKNLDLKPTVKFNIDPLTMTDEQKKDLRSEVVVMFDILQKNYNRNPMIYTTQEAFEAVFGTMEFDVNNLVVENLKMKPMIMDASRWNFWQFSIDGKAAGIPTAVCKLVYTGNEKDFENYMAHTK